MNVNGTTSAGHPPEGYPDCPYCGGEVRPGSGAYDFRRGGKLCIIEDLPLGICGQCGERFVHASVSASIDRLLDGEAGPPRKVEVSAWSFTDLVDAA